MAGRVTPSEAFALMTNEGFAYLDVRTVAEFDAGHPTGAYNVPLLVDGPEGRAPNAAFVACATRAFPDRAHKLVIGCLAATRSAHAAELLESAGYTNVSVQSAGWGGLVDAFGRATTPGWKAAGLPSATRAEPGHSWSELART